MINKVVLDKKLSKSQLIIFNQLYDIFYNSNKLDLESSYINIDNDFLNIYFIPNGIHNCCPICISLGEKNQINLCFNESSNIYEHTIDNYDDIDLVLISLRCIIKSTICEKLYFNNNLKLVKAKYEYEYEYLGERFNYKHTTYLTFNFFSKN